MPILELLITCGVRVQKLFIVTLGYNITHSYNQLLLLKLFCCTQLHRTKKNFYSVAIFPAKMNTEYSGARCNDNEFN